MDTCSTLDDMQILTHPNPGLKTRCADVDCAAERDLGRLVETMAKRMYDAPGVGLAAPQIGVLKRVIVWDMDDNLHALVNPVIVELGDERIVEEEGCLSVPGISVPVERATTCVCEGQLIDGTPVRIEAEDLLARILQHETDHLDGVLIIDRCTPEDRKDAVRRYMAGERDW
jgi:peptide deformylase